MYCVVVGDIIHSRKMDDENRRDELRKEMESIFENINISYMGDILSEFGIVRGDAFEGILYSAAIAIDVVQEIIADFWTHGMNVRISVVVDRLTTFHLDRNKSDGPAFHIATEEIDQLKKENMNHWLQIRYANSQKDMSVVNALSQMMGALSKNWTEKQKCIAFAMRKLDNKQNAVAQLLDVSASVVNRQIKSIDYDSYRYAWETIRSVFDKMEDGEALKEETQNFVEKYARGRKLVKKKYLEEAACYFEDAYEDSVASFGELDIRTLPFLNGFIECSILQREKFKDHYNDVRNRDAILAMHEKTVSRIKKMAELDKKTEKSLEHVRSKLLMGDWYKQREEYGVAELKYYDARNYLLQFYDNNHSLETEINKKLMDISTYKSEKKGQQGGNNDI